MSMDAADLIHRAVQDDPQWAERKDSHGPQEHGAELGQAGDQHYGAQHDELSFASAVPATEEAPAEAGAEGQAGKLMAAAKTQLGVNYVYGAHQWGEALDCSGFTQGAYAQIGVKIGGDTYSQVQQGTAVPDLAHAKPGDLVFTMGDHGNRVNGHVGIYMGGGQVMAAPRTGSVVQIQDWSHRSLTAIRRYI